MISSFSQLRNNTHEQNSKSKKTIEIDKKQKNISNKMTKMITKEIEKAMT